MLTKDVVYDNIWVSTPELRWRRVGSVALLEQKWRNLNDMEEWRLVPTVDEEVPNAD